MFGTTPKGNPSPPTKESKEESVIARGLSLTGELTGSGIVRLDGHFNGVISCNRLIVGPDGLMEGKVRAETVLVQGSIRGEIQADHVTLTRSAKVTGNVYHQVLEVEAGATVEGRYSRNIPEKADISAKVIAHGKGKPQPTAIQTVPKLPLGQGDGVATSGGLPAAE